MAREKRLPRSPSSHAVSRWRLRVDPAADYRAAHRAIREICAQGRVVSTPRGWVGRMVRDIGAGCVAIIAPTHPDVALIARGDTIVTVYARGCFRKADNGKERSRAGRGAGPERRARRTDLDKRRRA